MKVGATTRVFALLGDPVSHSLSPRMQNAGFQAAGLDAVYVALRCDESALPRIMETLVQSGGGGNVTIPHKAAAARAGVADARVTSIGVANVFHGGDGGLHVGNTDVDGVLAMLDSIGAPAAGWCVVGTGGSARAVAAAAAERGARLAVRSRDPLRAREFAAWAASIGAQPTQAEACQVLINATPLGLHASDPMPVELDTMPVVSHVADLTYRDGENTALVAGALERGLAAADGREMLLIQGVAAWQYWFPDVVPPVEVMRAALR